MCSIFSVLWLLDVLIAEISVEVPRRFCTLVMTQSISVVYLDVARTDSSSFVNVGRVRFQRAFGAIVAVHVIAVCLIVSADHTVGEG